MKASAIENGHVYPMDGPGSVWSACHLSSIALIMSVRISSL
jgi:hypothetical protein